MWKTLVCALGVVAGTVALPTAGRAQPVEADARLAESLAQQAFEAYAKGEFAAAIALYKKAYETSPAGVILFNIANIYDRKLDDKERALDYYQRYLRSSDTEPELVKRTSERLDRLRAALEAARSGEPGDRPPPQPATSSPPASTTPAPAAPTGARPPPVARGGRPLRIAGVAAAAAGLGGLAVGSAYGLLAKSKNDEAAMICHGDVCPDRRGVTLTDEARRAARVSTASFIVGGALVAGGVGLIIYGSAGKAERASRTALRITPQLGGLAISGTWP